MKLALAIFFCAALFASAVTVNLIWQPTPDEGAAGYKIYYGTDGEPFTNQVDVGNALTGSVTGLVAGVTYDFAVTAYDTNGLESDFSDTLVYTVPDTTTNVTIEVPMRFLLFSR